MNTIGPLLILFMGVVVLGGGIFSCVRQYIQITQFRRAEGVVIELLGSRAGRPAFVVAKTEAGMKIESKTRYRPHVRFTTESGRTATVVGRVAARPPRYTIGERVQVLYNPHNPAEAHLDNFIELWFVTLMLVGFGLLTTGMGLLGWWIGGL